jgi:glutathione S-transferase
VHKIDISKDTQKEPWFRAINPNGRIPALTDTFTDGKPINLFESGGIMQYLVERYDTEYKISFPKGTREYYEMNNWLFFMNAGVGPMQGQASKYKLFICHRGNEAMVVTKWIDSLVQGYHLFAIRSTNVAKVHTQYP